MHSSYSVQRKRMNVADNHRISSIITIFFYVTSWITQSVSGQALFGRNSPSNFMFVSPSRYGASNPNAPSGEIIHKSSLPAKNQVQYAGAGASLKPGYCPSVVLITSTKCADLCGDDNDCVGMKKCCRNGCGKRCIEPVHQAQNPPSQQQAQNAPPQQQVQNAPPQQQVQNAPPQQQAQNHPSNRQTQNAPTEHQPIINNKPDLFPGVPPSQLYGANHLPNTVNGGPMFHRPNSSAPQSEAVYNQRNQPNIAGPNNFYQQQHTGTNDPQGNVPSNGSVGSFYPPSTPTNGQHQINEIQGHSYIPQGTINSQAPAANNPWTSNAQSPSYPGHIGGQAPGYDPASPTIQGGASNSQHRNIQMGVSQNQTAGYDPHQNLPSGSNPPYQYNGLPNGNGQPNLNNPPPYSAPNGPNNPSPETYDQVSGLYNQQFPQPSSYNPSQPYHAATGGSSYRPAVPNNQYSNPAGGPNSDPYQQQVSGGTNVHNFTTEYSGGAYDPSVQQRHQQQHTERGNGESVSHVEYPMGAHQKEGGSNSQFYDPVGQTGPDGNLYEPHPNIPGQNQFIQVLNTNGPYQNTHMQNPNGYPQSGPIPNQNGPQQIGPRNNLNEAYQNGPRPFPNRLNQDVHNPYSSEPYQNKPSENYNSPRGHQNGPLQNGPGQNQNGQSLQSNSPHHIQTPNSVPNLPGQEGLPNSPYNEPRRSEPHHKPQHAENTRNTQYNSAGAVYPHQQSAYQKAQRSNNVLQIRPYKVGKGNSVVEILPYDGESRVPLVNGNTQNYNQDQYHHEQINREPTNAVQYPQNGADNSLYSPNTGPPKNMIQQVGEPEGIQQVQPEVRDMIPNSAVKLKPSIYGSYKIIPYDMRKYGKSKPMRSNLSGQGMGSNMNSNAPTEVKAPETIPKPASGVGPWPVGYEVTSRVHPGNSVQNQAFNTRQPRTYSNVEPKIPVEIKQTNQHQQENRGFNARTTAGIAPRWFSDKTVSYQGPKDIHTAGPEFPVPVVDKRVTYPEIESLATIKHPSSSSKNKEVSPKWDRKGKESSPQISPIPVQNALSTPAVEPKVGPREPESITKSPSFTNMVHTNGEPSSNNYNNLKQGQKEQTSIEPAGIVRDPGVNQKGDVTPGPSIKPSSNVAKNSFHDPHMDMNPMNSITYKDTRFGKNYYDPVTDHATLQEVNHHNHFESVHSRTRSQNKFSLMGGDPNPAGHVYNAAPPLQYNAANLGIVDYGQPRASAFEAQPVRRERMGLSARGDSSYGSGLSISRIYHDVGHSRAIMEPPTSFEFSSEFRKATAKPTYRPPIDSLGQVYIDIARFPDNPMQAPPNPLSLSSGFRGHIPDLLTTLPPLDKSTPKETPISYIEKKTTDAVSSLNLLEPPKTEKPAEPKNIIPEGMALTETGSKPKQMAPGSASQSSPSAPRLGISSTLIGAPPTNTGPEKKVFNRDGFNLFNGYKPQYKVPVKEIRNPSVRGAPVFSARAGKTLKKQ
uniref:WAP domain-containing protein n=1 Tax=Magallana gigas TaxID=29159 RepID=A0A8W8HKM7_MAGGI